MAETVTVQVVRNQFYDAGAVRTPDDDPFEVEKAVADDHPNRLEVVDADDDSDSDDTESATYTRDELGEMDYSRLRGLAMEYEGGEINGRSSRDDIVEELAEDEED